MHPVDPRTRALDEGWRRLPPQQATPAVGPYGHVRAPAASQHTASCTSPEANTPHLSAAWDSCHYREAPNSHTCAPASAFGVDATTPTQCKPSAGIATSSTLTHTPGHYTHSTSPAAPMQPPTPAAAPPANPVPTAFSPGAPAPCPGTFWDPAWAHSAATYAPLPTPQPCALPPAAGPTTTQAAPATQAVPTSSTTADATSPAAAAASLPPAPLASLPTGPVAYPPSGASIQIVAGPDGQLQVVYTTACPAPVPAVAPAPQPPQLHELQLQEQQEQQRQVSGPAASRGGSVGDGAVGLSHNHGEEHQALLLQGGDRAARGVARNGANRWGSPQGQEAPAQADHEQVQHIHHHHHYQQPQQRPQEGLSVMLHVSTSLHGAGVQAAPAGGKQQQQQPPQQQAVSGAENDPGVRHAASSCADSYPRPGQGQGQGHGRQQQQRDGEAEAEAEAGRWERERDRERVWERHGSRERVHSAGWEGRSREEGDALGRGREAAGDRARCPPGGAERRHGDVDWRERDGRGEGDTVRSREAAGREGWDDGRRREEQGRGGAEVGDWQQRRRWEEDRGHGRATLKGGDGDRDNERTWLTERDRDRERHQEWDRERDKSRDRDRVAGGGAESRVREDARSLPHHRPPSGPDPWGRRAGEPHESYAPGSRRMDREGDRGTAATHPRSPRRDARDSNGGRESRGARDWAPRDPQVRGPWDGGPRDPRDSSGRDRRSPGRAGEAQRSDGWDARSRRHPQDQRGAWELREGRESREGRERRGMEGMSPNAGNAFEPRQPNPHYAASVHAHAAGRPRTTSPAVPLPYGRMDAGLASRHEARADSQARAAAAWGRRGEHTADARAKDGWGHGGQGTAERKGGLELMAREAGRQWANRGTGEGRVCEDRRALQHGRDPRDGGSGDPRDGHRDLGPQNGGRDLREGGRDPRDGGSSDPRDGRGSRDPRDIGRRDPRDGSTRDPRDDRSSSDPRDGASRDQDPRDGGSDPRDGGSDPRDGGSDPRNSSRDPRDMHSNKALPPMKEAAPQNPTSRASQAAGAAGAAHTRDSDGREDRVAGGKAGIVREASVRGAYDRIGTHDSYGRGVRGNSTGRGHVVLAGTSCGGGPQDLQTRDGRRWTADREGGEHPATKRPRTDGHGDVHAVGCGPGSGSGRGRGGRGGSGGREEAHGRGTGQGLQERGAQPQEERERGRMEEAGGGRDGEGRVENAGGGRVGEGRVEEGGRVEGRSEGEKAGGQSLGRDPKGVARPEGPRRLPKAPISLVQVRPGKSLAG